MHEMPGSTSAQPAVGALTRKGGHVMESRTEADTFTMVALSRHRHRPPHANSPSLSWWRHRAASKILLQSFFGPGYPSSGYPGPFVANILRRGGRPAEVRHVPVNKGVGCRGGDNLALDALPTAPPLYEANRGGAAGGGVDVALGARPSAVLLRPQAGLAGAPAFILPLAALYRLILTQRGLRFSYPTSSVALSFASPLPCAGASVVRP